MKGRYLAGVVIFAAVATFLATGAASAHWFGYDSEDASHEVIADQAKMVIAASGAPAGNLVGFLADHRGDLVAGVRGADLFLNGAHAIDGHCLRPDLDWNEEACPASAWNDFPDWSGLVFGDHGFNPDSGKGHLTGAGWLAQERGNETNRTDILGQFEAYARDVDSCSRDDRARRSADGWWPTYAALRSGADLPQFCRIGSLYERLPGASPVAKMNALESVIDESDAARMAGAFYRRAVDDYRAQRWAEAARHLGVAIHLVADVSNPEHTWDSPDKVSFSSLADHPNQSCRTFEGFFWTCYLSSFAEAFADVKGDFSHFPPEVWVQLTARAMHRSGDLDPTQVASQVARVAVRSTVGLLMSFGRDVGLVQGGTSQWHFDTPGHREGWTPNSDILASSVEDDGKLRLDPSGADPWIEIDGLELDANSYGSLALSIASNAADKNGVLFWKRQGDSIFDPERSVPFSVPEVMGPEGEASFETVVVPLAEAPEWSNLVTSLRIDVTNPPNQASVDPGGGDTIGIDWIEFQGGTGVVLGSVAGPASSAIRLPTLYSQRDFPGVSLAGQPSLPFPGWGCAVTSVAMVLEYHGWEGNPESLNTWLTDNSGFDSEANFRWPVAAPLADLDYVRFTDPSRLDGELATGNPVIAKVETEATSYPYHWVVVVGREGSSYLVADPWTGTIHSLDEPLGGLGSYTLLSEFRLYRPVDALPADVTPGELVVSSSLAMDPSHASGGATVGTSFELTNIGGTALHFDRVGVGGRGPGGTANVEDFPFAEGVVIGPGATFTFRSSRPFTDPGSHRFNVWVEQSGQGTIPPTMPGVTATATLEVATTPLTEDNKAPVAGMCLSWSEMSSRAGQTLTVNGPDTGTISLDASESCGTMDVDGEIVAYEWRLNGVVISNERSALVDVSVPEEGINELRVTVTDDDGAMADEVGYVDRIREAGDVTPPDTDAPIIYMHGGVETAGLATIEPDGSNLQFLDTGSGLTGCPAWSPDKTEIAFQRTHTEGATVIGIEIVISGADGQNDRVLVDAHGCPSWSPDGARLAYDRDPDGIGVWVIEADGTNKIEIAEGGDPAWSPDGSLIALAGEGYLWTTPAPGSNAEGNTIIEGGSKPDWHPDGTKLVFEMMVDGVTQIFTVNADGTELTQLTEGGFFSGGADPAWSPDGTRIAFSSDRSGDVELHVMDSNGENLTQLTETAEDEFPQAPDW